MCCDGAQDAATERQELVSQWEQRLQLAEEQTADAERRAREAASKAKRMETSSAMASTDELQELEVSLEAAEAAVAKERRLREQQQKLAAEARAAAEEAQGQIAAAEESRAAAEASAKAAKASLAKAQQTTTDNDDELSEKLQQLKEQLRDAEEHVAEVETERDDDVRQAEAERDEDVRQAEQQTRLAEDRATSLEQQLKEEQAKVQRMRDDAKASLAGSDLQMEERLQEAERRTEEVQREADEASRRTQLEHEKALHSLEVQTREAEDQASAAKHAADRDKAQLARLQEALDEADELAAKMRQEKRQMMAEQEEIETQAEAKIHKLETQKDAAEKAAREARSEAMKQSEILKERESMMEELAATQGAESGEVAAQLRAELQEASTRARDAALLAEQHKRALDQLRAAQSADGAADRVVEVIKEVPGPERIVEKIVEVEVIKEVPGPERIVEKIVEVEVIKTVPGPERIVEQTVKVPGPERVVVKEVAVPAAPGPVVSAFTPLTTAKQVLDSATVPPPAAPAAQPSTNAGQHLQDFRSQVADDETEDDDMLADLDGLDLPPPPPGESVPAAAAPAPAAPAAEVPPPPASQEDLNLPPGWTTEISTSTGQMYYYNAETGETTYDHPGTSESSSSQLPPGWTTEMSQSTGQMYYYNAETGETTYDFPTVATEDELVQIDVDMATGRGFGMEIEWDGSVVKCKPGSVSALAFVPCPSKIVSIGGVGVRSKEDVVEAVKQTGGQPTVRFSFLVSQEVLARREEAMAAPGPPPADTYVPQAASQMTQPPPASIVQEVRKSLYKGQGGFGMRIVDEGDVTFCTPGGVAEQDGVPVPSKIVEVNGFRVTTKREIFEQVQSRGEGEYVEFVFAVEQAQLPERFEGFIDKFSPAKGRKASPWQERFCVFEAGILSYFKGKSARAQFEDVDQDNSGTLDHGEIVYLCQSMGLKLKPEEINAAMAIMDKDGNGNVDFAEFEPWWKEHGGKAAKKTEPVGEIDFRMCSQLNIVEGGSLAEIHLVATGAKGQKEYKLRPHEHAQEWFEHFKSVLPPAAIVESGPLGGVAGAPPSPTASATGGAEEPPPGMSKMELLRWKRSRAKGTAPVAAAQASPVGGSGGLQALQSAGIATGSPGQPGGPPAGALPGAMGATADGDQKDAAKMAKTAAKLARSSAGAEVGSINQVKISLKNLGLDMYTSTFVEQQANIERLEDFERADWEGLLNQAAVQQPLHRQMIEVCCRVRVPLCRCTLPW
eukprot:COSAG01_NODE_990_length_12289_cov_22.606545_2_plen_1243_part_00